MLSGVLDALALVRLRLTMCTDLCCSLTDDFLVDAGDRDDRSRGALKRDALGRLNDNGMREAEREVQILALLCRTIADTADLKGLREAFRHTDHHVVDERAGKAVERPVHFIVRRTGDGYDTFLDGYFHIRMDLARKLALRALHFHEIIRTDRDGNARRNVNRCSSNS